MNPCRKTREQITLLLLNELDTEAEREVRAHLDACRGCQASFRQMSIIIRRLRSAQPQPGLQASVAFHQRVVRALKSESGESTLTRFQTWLGLAHSRWLLGVPAAAAIILIAGILMFLRPAPVTTAEVTKRAAALPRGDAEFDPTFFNYQVVASRSFETLDELLTKQGARNLPATPVYRASARSDLLQ